MVEECLRDTNGRTDCIEVDSGALTLHFYERFHYSATSFRTLFGGDAYNGLRVSL